DLTVIPDFGRTHAPKDVTWSDIRRARMASSPEHFEETLHSLLVIPEDANRLVTDVKAGNELRILCRDAGGTFVAVASQRLNAADRKHHRARGITHIRAERNLRHHRKAGMHFAGRDDPHLVAHVRADEGVVD